MKRILSTLLSGVLLVLIILGVVVVFGFWWGIVSFFVKNICNNYHKRESAPKLQILR